MDPSQAVTGRQLEEADVRFAALMLESGASSKDALAQLVERGVAPEIAAACARDLSNRAVHSQAADLVLKGLSPREAAERLVERGIEPDVAATAVRNVLNPPPARGEPIEHAEPARSDGGILQLFGLLVFVIGVGLFIGNVTRVFPTFPFAGFLVMTIGGLLWRSGGSRL
jgi:hypothetical protein